MAQDRTRIDFNAPTSLVKQADELAELLGTSRTRILVDALRDELDELANDEAVRRQVREAFYDSRIDVETAESIVGTEEALRMKLLRSSLNRNPPEPQLESAQDTDEFYDGGPPEWAPAEEDSDSDAEPTA